MLAPEKSILTKLRPKQKPLQNLVKSNFLKATEFSGFKTHMSKIKRINSSKMVVTLLENKGFVIFGLCEAV